MADTLSRIPGSELLSALELCSMFYTLNVLHFVDEPKSAKKCCTLKSHSIPLLNGIISINEKESFRD